MESITNLLSRAGNYLTTIGISDFIDILIVAFLIYRVIMFVKKSNFVNLAKGLLLLLLALWLSGVFGLIMINYILRKAVELGMIALVILFQPELRRLLERVGSSFNRKHNAVGTVMDATIEQTVQACSDMSASRTGALIVFERKISLGPVIATGTVINADANAELIKNLFFNKAPLHDGAVIIRDARVEAAGCTLPLTQAMNLSKDLGMRHKAGLGMSEQSDAVVVIVSEESGAISVALEGMLKRHLSEEELKKVLTDNLNTVDGQEDVPGILNSIRSFFKGFEHEDESKTE
ncbi:MAG: diadenylate cyclase CdaA [Oscillospiraceae bacterium]|nr:diadenylate cyclase CdaA [Oscillospiraceae bacterium]